MTRQTQQAAWPHVQLHQLHEIPASTDSRDATAALTAPSSDAAVIGPAVAHALPNSLLDTMTMLPSMIQICLFEIELHHMRSVSHRMHRLADVGLVTSRQHWYRRNAQLMREIVEQVRDARAARDARRAAASTLKKRQQKQEECDGAGEDDGGQSDQEEEGQPFRHGAMQYRLCLEAELNIQEGALTRRQIAMERAAIENRESAQSSRQKRQEYDMNGQCSEDPCPLISELIHALASTPARSYLREEFFHWAGTSALEYLFLSFMRASSMYSAPGRVDMSSLRQLHRLILWSLHFGYLEATRMLPLQEGDAGERELDDEWRFGLAAFEYPSRPTEVKGMFDAPHEKREWQQMRIDLLRLCLTSQREHALQYQRYRLFDAPPRLPLIKQTGTFLPWPAEDSDKKEEEAKEEEQPDQDVTKARAATEDDAEENARDVAVNDPHRDAAVDDDPNGDENSTTDEANAAMPENPYYDGHQWSAEVSYLRLLCNSELYQAYIHVQLREDGPVALLHNLVRMFQYDAERYILPIIEDGTLLRLLAHNTPLSTADEATVQPVTVFTLESRAADNTLILDRIIAEPHSRACFSALVYHCCERWNSTLLRALMHIIAPRRLTDVIDAPVTFTPPARDDGHGRKFSSRRAVLPMSVASIASATLLHFLCHPACQMTGGSRHRMFALLLKDAIRPDADCNLEALLSSTATLFPDGVTRSLHSSLQLHGNVSMLRRLLNAGTLPRSAFPDVELNPSLLSLVKLPLCMREQILAQLAEHKARRGAFTEAGASRQDSRAFTAWRALDVDPATMSKPDLTSLNEFAARTSTLIGVLGAGGNMPFDHTRDGFTLDKLILGPGHCNGWQQRAGAYEETFDVCVTSDSSDGRTEAASPMPHTEEQASTLSAIEAIFDSQLALIRAILISQTSTVWDKRARCETAQVIRVVFGVITHERYRQNEVGGSAHRPWRLRVQMRRMRALHELVRWCAYLLSVHPHGVAVTASPDLSPDIIGTNEIYRTALDLAVLGSADVHLADESQRNELRSLEHETARQLFDSAAIRLCACYRTAAPTDFLRILLTAGDAYCPCQLVVERRDAATPRFHRHEVQDEEQEDEDGTEQTDKPAAPMGEPDRTAYYHARIEAYPALLRDLLSTMHRSPAARRLFVELLESRRPLFGECAAGRVTSSTLGVVQSSAGGSIAISVLSQDVTDNLCGQLLCYRLKTIFFALLERKEKASIVAFLGVTKGLLLNSASFVEHSTSLSPLHYLVQHVRGCRHRIFEMLLEDALDAASAATSDDDGTSVDDRLSSTLASRDPNGCTLLDALRLPRNAKMIASLSSLDLHAHIIGGPNPRHLLLDPSRLDP